VDESATGAVYLSSDSNAEAATGPLVGPGFPLSRLCTSV